MTPASLSCRMNAGVVRSGASVTMVTPPCGRVSSWTASPSSARSLLGSWMPRRASLRKGPSMWMPSTPGTPRAMASRTASMARATTSRSSLISVGRKPVVPKRRCALAIAAMVSTDGSSLNSSPPPPLTWQSMKPGASSAPPQVDDTVRAHHFARGHHGLDAAVAHQHRALLLEALVGEDLPVAERQQHQTVSVTL